MVGGAGLAPRGRQPRAARRPPPGAPVGPGPALPRRRGPPRPGGERGASPRGRPGADRPRGRRPPPTGAEASLAIARGGQALDDPPAAFGTIRPRRLLAALDRAEPRGRRRARLPARPRAQPERISTTRSTRRRRRGRRRAERRPPAVEPGRRRGTAGSAAPTPGEPDAGAGGRRSCRRGRADPRRPGPVGRPPRRRCRHAVRPRRSTRPTLFAPQGEDVSRVGRPTGGATGPTGAPCTSATRAPATWRRWRCPTGVALRRPLARLGTGLVPHPSAAPGRRHRHRRRRRGAGRGAGGLAARRGGLRREPPAAARPRRAGPPRRLGLGGGARARRADGARAPAVGRRRAHDGAARPRRPRGALRLQLPGSARRVHVTRVKGFDDRLDGRVVRRLGGLVPGGLHPARRRHPPRRDRAGGARRDVAAAPRSSSRTGSRTTTATRARTARRDARRALAEARRRGTGCLCLSVGAGTDPAALRRVFGTAAHATVPTPEQLPGLIGPLFRAALRSAEAQRRVFQRKERTRVRLELDRRMS